MLNVNLTLSKKPFFTFWTYKYNIKSFFPISLILSFRCMYGSDWPVSRLAEGVNYEEVIQLLRDLIKDRSDEDKKAIFRQTAINFYSLQDVL